MCAHSRIGLLLAASTGLAFVACFQPVAEPSTSSTSSGGGTTSGGTSGGSTPGSAGTTGGNSSGGSSGGTTSSGDGGEPDGGPDCNAKWNAYVEAISAAEQCNPAAAVPCTPYQFLCGPLGVNPDDTVSLTAMLSEYTGAGCKVPSLECPIFAESPAPYTCQPGTGGRNVCYSFCANLPKGTCVSQSTGCGDGVSALQGYCSGTSMECCLLLGG
jgi:hypothetical protein